MADITQSSVLNIDEVALFDRVLTPEEIATLYSFVPDITMYDGTMHDVLAVKVWH